MVSVNHYQCESESSALSNAWILVLNLPIQCTVSCCFETHHYTAKALENCSVPSIQ